jgi:MoaA/NifB/PqqE/SkfB family radical SAM enzyme
MAKFQEFLTFIITLRCPNECLHCLVDAGPEREEEMNTVDLLTWIREAARYPNIRCIAIGGGEPFFYKKLPVVIAEARHRGLNVGVLTSAYWASDVSVAKEMLNELGHLTYLGISTDRFHQRYVSIERVRNAIIAAREVGVSEIAINVNYLREKESMLEEVKTELGMDLSRIKVFTSPVIPVGRAAREIPWKSFPFKEGFTKKVCQAINYPSVFPTGIVHACAGPLTALGEKDPLVLGNLYEESLSKILNREKQEHYLVHALRLWGPYTLAHWTMEAGLEEHLRGHYIPDDPCDLCCDLFSKPEIVQFLQEKMKEPSLRQEVARWRLF